MNIYQESGTSLFESEGSFYDLNKIFLLSHSLPTVRVEISDLLWQHDSQGGLDFCRVQKADLNVPLLVTQMFQGCLVLDGEHRTEKAIRENIKTLPVKFLTKEIFESTLVLD